MKTTILCGILGALALPLSFGQTPPSVSITPGTMSKRAALPKYAVYEFFLGWVSALDKQATAAGVSDAYKFAEPFAHHAGLANTDLDLLRGEAKALEADLKNQDGKASGVIQAFRAKAKAAAQTGQPLPPPPPEIHQLQRERTALLVQHFVKLRQSLGQDTSSRLDQYLAREFTPHLSMRTVAVPKSPASPGTQPPFTGVPR